MKETQRNAWFLSFKIKRNTSHCDVGYNLITNSQVMGLSLWLFFAFNFNGMKCNVMKRELNAKNKHNKDQPMKREQNHQINHSLSLQSSVTIQVFLGTLGFYLQHKEFVGFILCSS